MARESAHSLGPAEIRDLAALLGIQPTKKLGQNFVIDANTVRRIVRVAGVQPGRDRRRGRAGARVAHARAARGRSIRRRRRDRQAARRPAAADRRNSCSRMPTLTVVTDDAMRVTELPGDADDARRQPAVQRLGARAAALSGALSAHRPPGSSWCRPRSGQRIAAPPGSKVYGSPEREGRLVRRLEDGRAGQPGRCSGRCRTSTRSSSSFRAARAAARHRGGAAGDLRARGCRVPAAAEDAAAGARRCSRGQRCGIRASWRRPVSRRRRAARS